MNIPNEIADYAFSKGLSWVGTGGGLDYIGFSVSLDESENDAFDVFVTYQDDAGCPDTLDEISALYIARNNYNTGDYHYLIIDCGKTCKQWINAISQPLYGIYLAWLLEQNTKKENKGGANNE